MKRTFSILALTFVFSLACLAADQNFYGAWYVTSQTLKGVAKDAGGCSVVLRESTGAIPWQDQLAEFTIHHGEGTTETFVGYWEQGRNANTVEIILEETPANIPYAGPYFTCRLNVTTGQITGKFSTGLRKGKFQLKRD